MRHFYVTKAYKKPFVLNTIFGYLFNPYGHMKADWKKNRNVSITFDRSVFFETEWLPKTDTRKAP